MKKLLLSLGALAAVAAPVAAVVACGADKAPTTPAKTNPSHAHQAGPANVDGKGGDATNAGASTTTDAGASTTTDAGASTTTDAGTSTTTDAGTSTTTDAGTSTTTDATVTTPVAPTIPKASVVTKVTTVTKTLDSKFTETQFEKISGISPTDNDGNDALGLDSTFGITLGAHGTISNFNYDATTKLLTFTADGKNYVITIATVASATDATATAAVGTGPLTESATSSLTRDEIIGAGIDPGTTFSADELAQKLGVTFSPEMAIAIGDSVKASLNLNPLQVSFENETLGYDVAILNVKSSDASAHTVKAYRASSSMTVSATPLPSGAAFAVASLQEACSALGITAPAGAQDIIDKAVSADHGVEFEWDLDKSILSVNVGSTILFTITVS